MHKQASIGPNPPYSTNIISDLRPRSHEYYSTNFEDIFSFPVCAAACDHVVINLIVVIRAGSRHVGALSNQPSFLFFGTGPGWLSLCSTCF